MTEEQKDTTYYMPEIFKKWHKYGFISVRYWPGGEKVQIEIGDIVTNNGEKTIKSVSKCYLKLYEFQSYLHAEINNQILHIMPEFETDEWRVFGGTRGPQPVSRVFTAGYWKSGKDSPVDKTARGFRCAHYEGSVGANGEINPIWDKPISFNFIRLTMFDLAQMYHHLDSLVHAYTIQKADQVVVFDDE